MSDEPDPVYQIILRPPYEESDMSLSDEFASNDGNDNCEIILKVNDDVANRFRTSLDNGIACLGHFNDMCREIER